MWVLLFARVLVQAVRCDFMHAMHSVRPAAARCCIRAPSCRLLTYTSYTIRSIHMCNHHGLHAYPAIDFIPLFTLMSLQ